MNPEALLGSLVSGFVSRHTGGYGVSRRASMAVPGGMATIGLLGAIAAGAYEHFSQKQPATPAPGAAPAGGPPPLPPQGAAPPPQGTAAPPPLPMPPLAMPPLPMPPPMPPGPPPVPVQGAPAAVDPDEAVALIRVMVAAAAADGTIDAEERAAILAGAGAGDAEDRAFLEGLLANPPRLKEVVAPAADRPELAPRLYAAALMAITLDRDAEHMWLRALKERLKLPDAAVADMHEAAGQPPLQ